LHPEKAGSIHDASGAVTDAANQRISHGKHGDGARRSVERREEPVYHVGRKKGARGIVDQHQIGASGCGDLLKASANRPPAAVRALRDRYNLLRGNQGGHGVFLASADDEHKRFDPWMTRQRIDGMGNHCFASDAAELLGRAPTRAAALPRGNNQCDDPVLVRCHGARVDEGDALRQSRLLAARLLFG
jgi:hypothetical protein